jgi:two-component sensor histidine kinase
MRYGRKSNHNSGPCITQFLSGASGAFFAEDLLIKVQRRGTSEWEEARFTVSFSPIPDENASPAGVGGVLVTAVDHSMWIGRPIPPHQQAVLRDRRPFGGWASDASRAGHNHPDDRESDAALRQRLVADGIPFVVEKRYLRPEGSVVWVSVNVLLMRSTGGTRQQFIGVAQDITGRKVAREQQGLLVRELNHRIKNLFAITDGMIALGVRSARTPSDYASNMRGRLNALASAHDLILPSFSGDSITTAEPVSLETLLRTILSPYVGLTGGNSDARIIPGGPPIALGPRAMTNLAIAQHELATNAAKYGALSVEEGQLRVSWELMEHRLILKWKESGGPALRGAPRSEGFGTVISDHCIRAQFGGTASRKWDWDGLLVELSVPTARSGDWNAVTREGNMFERTDLAPSPLDWSVATLRRKSR